jgi:homotetrameric cytidine deaminase
MKDKEVWDMLITRAKEVLNPRIISPFIEAGGVGAAILTKNGNVYTGVCIDTASTLGMCAERNAIANMITNGESQIDKLVCVMRNGEVGSPCGACREYLMQLDRDSKNIVILRNKDTYETIRLEELIPDWWGYDRFNEDV